MRDRSRGSFLAAEAVIWASFLFLDLFRGGAGSVPLKFGGVALCFLFAYWHLPLGGDRLTAAALGLTVAADVFLLVLDRHYLLGVALFCAVQGCYLARVSRAGGGRTLWPLRLMLCTAALTFLYCLGLLDLLNALSLVYFANFFCNVLQAAFLTGRRNRLFFAGLLLFLCCDACVGVFNQPGLFPATLANFASIGMWLFYLPGQVLIALSSA